MVKTMSATNNADGLELSASEREAILAQRASAGTKHEVPEFAQKAQGYKNKALMPILGADSENGVVCLNVQGSKPVICGGRLQVTFVTMRGRFKKQSGGSSDKEVEIRLRIDGKDASATANLKAMKQDGDGHMGAFRSLTQSLAYKCCMKSHDLDDLRAAGFWESVWFPAFITGQDARTGEAVLSLAELATIVACFSRADRDESDDLWLPAPPSAEAWAKCQKTVATLLSRLGVDKRVTTSAGSAIVPKVITGGY